MNNKELIAKFKESMQDVASTLSIYPHELTRDKYIKEAIKADIPRLNKMQLNSIGGFANAKDLFFPTPDAPEAMVAAKIIRSERNKLQKKFSEENFYKNEFLSTVKDALVKNPIVLHAPVKESTKKTTFKRTVLVHISDTHFGCHIEPDEVGGRNSFNWTVASRRLATLAEQVATYKPEYRKDSDLVVILNGDILAGIIHNQEWFVDLITTQFSGAVNILGQFLSYVATKYSKVTVYATPGNHGRMKHKADSGRATTHKWDNYETMVFIALQEVFKNHKNVDIYLKESPLVVFNVQGHRMAMTHGDTVFNVGMPGKSINMKSIKDQLNNLNASIPASDKVAAFFVGHVHTPTVQLLDNGVYAIINGCLSGLDPFANSIGIFHSHATQQIIEVTPNYAVGDMRFVRLDGNDNKKELDAIIKPFNRKF